MSIFGSVVGRLVSAVQGVMTPDSADPPQQQPAPSSPSPPSSWWPGTAAVVLLGGAAIGLLAACPPARGAVLSAVGGAASCLGELPPFSPLRDHLAGTVGPQLREAFITGTVQVGGKSAWDIGVAMETVNRKHQTDVCLSNGFAVLMLRNGTKIIACDRPPVELNLPKTPEKVGVFVDHEEGEVCFYDIGNTAHIYSFTCCRFPRKKLLPYFNPCTQREGSNSAPMVITPVS